jgi:riboflavin transporter FmnP
MFLSMSVEYMKQEERSASPLKLNRSYLITSTALFSTIALIMDLLPNIRVPWGMQVDLVGTIWVLSYFLYGPISALMVGAITTLGMIAFGSSGYIGPFMKFAATAPMFLIPHAIISLPFFKDKGSKQLGRWQLLLASVIFANLARILVTSTLNLYVAIPIWWGIPSTEVLTRFGGLTGFLAFIISLNLLQGVIDTVTPWFIAYKTKLVERFGTW